MATESVLSGVELLADGRLANLDDWNRDVAEVLAANDGITTWHGKPVLTVSTTPCCSSYSPTMCCFKAPGLPVSRYRCSMLNWNVPPIPPKRRLPPRHRISQAALSSRENSTL